MGKPLLTLIAAVLLVALIAGSAGATAIYPRTGVTPGKYGCPPGYRLEFAGFSSTDTTLGDSMTCVRSSTTPLPTTPSIVSQLLKIMATPTPTQKLLKFPTPASYRVEFPVISVGATPTLRPIATVLPPGNTNSDAKIEQAISLMREVGGSSIDRDLSTCPKTTKNEVISCVNTFLAGINVLKQKNAEAGRLLSSAQPTSQYPSTTLNTIRTIQTYQKYELDALEAGIQVKLADANTEVNPDYASTYISRARSYIQRGNAALRQLETYCPKINPDDYSRFTQDTMTDKNEIIKLHSFFDAFTAAYDGLDHYMNAATYLKNKKTSLAVTEMKNALLDFNKAQALGYPGLAPLIEDLNNALMNLGYE